MLWSRMAVAFAIVCLSTLVGYAQQCVSPGTTINFSISGNNTTAGYTTTYVLTDNSGSIIQTVASGFAAPGSNGTYMVYAVNYNTASGNTAPTLTAGTSITAVGGTCSANSTPITFCVSTTDGCVAGGTAINFSTSGNNTTTGYTTTYVLTDASGAIISTSASSPIAAPATGGTYNIYAVNYNTASGNTAPTLTAGTSITAIGGTCAASSTPISFTVCTAQPVALVWFKAQAQPDKTVGVSWQTSMESGNKGYIVERSKDLISFEQVGEANTDVAGNSRSLHTYQLTDLNPYRGTSYYRLKQLDLSGATHTYAAVPVNIDGVYGVYPNPISGHSFTLMLDEPTTAVLHFYDVSGKGFGLEKISHGESTLELKPVQKLTVGIYLLTVEERGQVRKHRLVVQ